MINSLFEKPYKLVSIIGFVYIMANIILNIAIGFSFDNAIYPFSEIITYSAQGIALIFCALTFFFYTKHFLYFISIEVLVFSNVYNGNIYSSLFLSSFLLVIILTENKTLSKRKVVIYGIMEIIKMLIIVPYGVTQFFNYVGLTLFSLCTIGCINLLFRHAYSRKENSTINMDDYKLSDRQKDCIKEIVVNNTTIKALSITYKVSESAIKKDLAHIYKVLGITGKSDLKALFIGYKFD